MKLVLGIAAAAVVCASCVRTPTEPAASQAFQPMQDGMYVVCEGLWRQDNSVLSYVDEMRSVAVRDVLAANAPGHRLGDTAGDVVVRGDTMFIAVATSHAIEVLRMSTGTWIARIEMPSTQQPRSIAIVNDSVAVCTNMNDDSFTLIDTRRLLLLANGVHVGPAPDGVAATTDKIFIGNSGFGDLRATEEGAGTVTVLSASDLTVMATIADLPNVAVLRTDRDRRRCWVSYRELPSHKDSLGGVALIDTRSLKIVARWRFAGMTSIDVDPVTGNCYALHAGGVDVISAERSTTQRLIAKPTSNTDAWYAIGYQPSTRRLWIGNAKNYVIDGEVFAVAEDGSTVARGPVGLNPSAFAFVP